MDTLNTLYNPENAEPVKPGRLPKRKEHVDMAVLVELERLRIELLANISNQLRTPLTSIKGFASTLLQRDIKWSEKERREFLESIEEEIDRLNNIITGVLDSTHLEKGTIKLEKGDWQVSDIINSIKDQAAAIARHHHLSVNIPPDLPEVHVDSRRIGQVIINLVQNAVKYSKEDSPIVIEAKSSQNQVVISVIDKGIGVPQHLLNKMFNRFYHVEDIVHGNQGRNDIGLSICRSIIEAHGSKIWVESKAGDGSCFSFSLPISQKSGGPH